MLVPNAPGLSSASAATGIGTQQDLGDKQIFLKLLVAQMENQDPLKPQDPTQMSAQLAQFNMVEQQTNTNKWLEQIAAGNGLSNSGGASGSDASYLGRTVTLNQSNVAFNGSPVSFDARLDGNATQSFIVIRNGEGTPIRTISLGAKNAGTHPMTWDGVNDLGNPSPPGNYNIEIAATDIQGLIVPAFAQRSGIVDAVRFTSSGTEFVVGGMPASLSDITEIRL
ncbi:MAG: flagellar hook assembly protein FlgD [Mariprofundaceae bacterium]